MAGGEHGGTDRGRGGSGGRAPFWAWPLLVVDLAIHAAEHMRPVGGARGTFFLAVHRYRGRPITLADGTAVRIGDVIGEIHIWNAHLPQYRAAGERAAFWRLLKDFNRDMRTLAAEVAAGRVPDEVQAFIGVTPLARAARRLGFTVRELPRGPWRSFLTVWQGMLRAGFRPTGDSRLPATSAECWISRSDLLRLFQGTAEAAADRGPAGRGASGTPTAVAAGTSGRDGTGGGAGVQADQDEGRGRNGTRAAPGGPAAANGRPRRSEVTRGLDAGTRGRGPSQSG